jgi:hypothetical protein
MTQHPQLPSFLASEATGDWSGLKGSDYHVLVAVYLMLVHARDVSFYAGNDIRSIATAQPVPVEGGLIGIQATEIDEWIQVKNVDQPWTAHRLLRERTLMTSFVLNALWSEHQGREWRVELISTSTIKSDDITQFLNTLESFRNTGKPDTQKHYQKTVAEVYKRWSLWVASQGDIVRHSQSDIDAIAKRILNQIAHCQAIIPPRIWTGA